jgi:hypothetical protein
MTETPQRYKADEQMTTGDWVAFRRTGERPETDEYRAYVRRVHEDAGLDPPDQAEAPKPLEEQTAEDHFQRIRKGT